MVAVDTFRKVLTLHLRQRQVDKAVAISARLTALLQGLQSAHLLERQHLVHVILLLEFGDYVEAAKQYQVYVGEYEWWWECACILLTRQSTIIFQITGIRALRRGGDCGHAVGWL